MQHPLKIYNNKNKRKKMANGMLMLVDDAGIDEMMMDWTDYK